MTDTYVFTGTATAQYVYKFKTSDLSYVTRSTYYNGTIKGMAIDDTYVYSGTEGDKVNKFNKSDLAYVTQSPSLTNDVCGIDTDTNYVYALISASSGNIKKLEKSLSSVLCTGNFGTYPYRIEEDGNYVYVTGSAQYVKKFNKSDLSLVATSANLGGNLYDVEVDENYVYTYVQTIKKIKKLNKSDLSYVGESAALPYDMFRICHDNEYLYISPMGSPYYIRKLRKSDLAVVATSNHDINASVNDMECDRDYVYAGYSGYVKKFSKSDLSYLAVSGNYPTVYELEVEVPPILEKSLSESISQSETIRKQFGKNIIETVFNINDSNIIISKLIEENLIDTVNIEELFEKIKLTYEDLTDSIDVDDFISSSWGKFLTDTVNVEELFEKTGELFFTEALSVTETFDKLLCAFLEFFETLNINEAFAKKQQYVVDYFTLKNVNPISADYIIRPNSTYDYTGCCLPVPSQVTDDYYLNVDEIICNGDTDYIKTFFDESTVTDDNVNNYVWFGFEKIPEYYEDFKINHIDIIMYVKKIAPTGNGNDVYNASINCGEIFNNYNFINELTSDYTKKTVTYYTNPYTGKAWTYDELRNEDIVKYYFGVHHLANKGVDVECRLSQMYIKVFFDTEATDLSVSLPLPSIITVNHSIDTKSLSFQSGHYKSYPISRRGKTISLTGLLWDGCVDGEKTCEEIINNVKQLIKTLKPVKIQHFKLSYYNNVEFNVTDFKYTQIQQNPNTYTWELVLEFRKKG